ncbi:MAG: hypothetical protein IE909_01215 [Campylobacterales bacterium]|nr:hypothetical protein [Campylobacterales bacterium]
MLSIIKFVSHITLFLFVLVVFSPKEKLYFYAIDLLQTYKVDVNQLNIQQKLNGLNVDSLTLHYDGINTSSISSFGLSTYLLDTRIYMKDILVSDGFKNFLPQKINNINLHHTIFNPIIINVDCNFDGGKIFGTIDLVDRIIKVQVHTSKKFKTLYPIVVKQMKLLESKTQEDIYEYEHKF